MSNTIFIKEVNNQPVIFNVDNATDIARLEALQAVKMSDNLVRSVFGENSMYADNTTCTITDNPDNPAFPYNVTFNASKIIDTPKRYYGYLAQKAMPSNKYIQYLNVESGNQYRAPANGYFVFYVNFGTNDGFCRLKWKSSMFASESRGVGIPVVFIPVLKGQIVIATYSSDLTASRNTDLYFFYAYGEI